MTPSNPTRRKSALFPLLIALIFSCAASAQTTLFFDDFSGPTLNSAYQPILPAAGWRFGGCGTATYVGASSFSFQTLDSATVIRLQNTLDNAQRKGWSTSTEFPSNLSIRLEARLNTVVQSPATGIDELLELWILDPTNLSRYDKVALSAPDFGSTRVFTAGSSITNIGLDTGVPPCAGVGQGAFTFSNNTWYRLVITGSPSTDVRLSVFDDTGTVELIGVSVGHTLSSYSSGFVIGFSQSMGLPGSPSPTDVAVDFIQLTGNTDITPPVVSLFAVITGPPKQVEISSQDTQSGLASIDVLNCTNCTALTPPFTSGTTSAVITAATKTNQSASSSIKLQATDVAGNSTVFDPVDITLQADGKMELHEVTISAQEHVVLIANGTPGIRNVILKIRNTEIPIRLADGETRSVDIARALEPGDHNVVKIFSTGKSGATASVVFTQP
jgi:hypothetical protein